MLIANSIRIISTSITIQRTCSTPTVRQTVYGSILKKIAYQLIQAVVVSCAVFLTAELHKQAGDRRRVNLKIMGYIGVKINKCE